VAVIRSMTGYGRASFAVEGVAFEVEVRSVNHRYLDARIRLPKPLADREADLKARIRSRMARGKVDLVVSQAGEAGSGPRLAVDLAAAEQYLAASRELVERHGVAGALDAQALLALPGVARFVEPKLSPEALHAALARAVDEALDAVVAMREAEGAALADEIEGRLQRVLALAESLEARSGLVQQAVRERLRKRAGQLKSETGVLDEARLHQEIVLAADRLDVTEEIVRLRSHVDQFRHILAAGADGEAVGRRLDFLLQEMAREANTIGSKGTDAPVSHDVVELKTELERIREQVQNLE
jgi:uncharacterized protein (TIGR00255 family)